MKSRAGCLILRNKEKRYVDHQIKELSIKCAGRDQQVSWDTAKMQISLAMQQVDPDGIVRDSDKLGGCFFDWSLELNKQAGAQGVLLYAMRSAIAIAEKLGKKQDAERMTQTYEFYKDAAIKHFYNEETGLFLSGKCRQVSYASQIWLILGGTVSPDEGL